MDDHNLYGMFWPYMWDFLRIPHLQTARFFMFFQFWRDQSFSLPDIFHSWGTLYQHFLKLLTSRNKDEDLTMACHLWFSNKTTTGYHLKIYYFITNLLKLGLNHHNMGLGQTTYDFPIWMRGETSSSSSDVNFLVGDIQGNSRNSMSATPNQRISVNVPNISLAKTPNLWEFSVGFNNSGWADWFWWLLQFLLDLAASVPLWYAMFSEFPDRVVYGFLDFALSFSSFGI